MEVYIYALIHPNTKEVRYIGKANNVEKRYRKHLLDASRRKYPVYNWINKLKNEGLLPSYVILENTNEIDWMDAEKNAISKHKELGCRLLNVAEGGNEPYCSKEVRAQNGKNIANAIHSDEKRKRLWSLKQQLGLDLKYLETKGDDDQKNRCKAIRAKLATRGIYLKSYGKN